jgi:membrane protease subunit (stomatin/prohibitin family)
VCAVAYPKLRGDATALVVLLQSIRITSLSYDSSLQSMRYRPNAAAIIPQNTVFVKSAAKGFHQS